MADLKVLKVCLSRDLPHYPDRLPNYIYFTYDTLSLYFGSEDALSENFAIVDEMPEQPVDHMIYIVLDGSIHQYIEYEDVKIAEIEDPEEIELIKKAGTSYFVNGDSRYIERVGRSLVLPFNNGIYELAVNTQEEDQFDNDTIAKYNEETGRFEIYGGTNEEYIAYDHKIKGFNTPTVATDVQGSRIFANIKLSSTFDNALHALSDGLYVRSDNKVDKSEFNKFAKDFRDFKAYAYAILDNLEAQIEYIESIISEESINAEIHTQLQAEFPFIDQAIEEYAEMRRLLDELETTAMAYASEIMHAGIDQIEAGIQHASSWQNIGNNVPEYSHEVDYYQKAYDWYHETISKDYLEVVVAVSIEEYEKIMLKERTAAIIAVAIDKYNQIIEEEQKRACVVAVSVDKYHQILNKEKTVAVIGVSVDKYNQIMLKEKNAAIIAVSVDKYNQIIDKETKEKNASVIAVSVDKYQQILQKEKNVAAIATAINAYNELNS